ncbi:MAG: hypothetical protein RL220_1894 [Bacteroidota bacterium]|jgi:hypothetical protein
MRQAMKLFHNNLNKNQLAHPMRWTIAIILTALCGVSFAQPTKYDKSRELGIAVGTAYYIGEINPTSHFGTRLKLSGGLTYRENLSKRWTIKTGLLYGQVEAWDADSDDPWMRNRNLHFRNQFFEGSMIAELNFFDYQIGNRQNWISPYLFAGLGYYSMKPQANFKGNWYELQPLGTEGQGTSEGEKKYSISGLSAPFGAGLKMNVWAIFALSLDWGVRKTWTDYFDDISTTYADPDLLEDENGELASLLGDQSLVKEGPAGNNAGMQRGDPGRKDWYFFCMLSLNIRLDKAPNSCWGK